MIPKEERISIYERMLERLNKDVEVICEGIFHSGLCFLLLVATKDIGSDIVDYPELMRYKPEHGYNGTDYWFNPHTKEGTNKRREILEDAIDNPIED